jgi:hypothetical protein
MYPNGDGELLPTFNKSFYTSHFSRFYVLMHPLKSNRVSKHGSTLGPRTI